MHADDSTPLPETLDDLIAYLEAERDGLKTVVESAAKEWEFSEARFYARSYRQVSRRLEVLKSLRDPGYDKRAHYYQLMVRLEEKITEHSNTPQLAKHFEQELVEVNRTLDELEKARHFPIDTQYIDDALFGLVQGTISNFTLHLNKDLGLMLQFECSEKCLHMKFLYKKGSLWPFMKKGLRRLGFRKVEGVRRFKRSSDVGDFKNAQSIKQLLAVLVFDVLGPSWLDRPMEMEINR